MIKTHRLFDVGDMVKVFVPDRITHPILITDVYEDSNHGWCYKLSINMSIRTCYFDIIAEKIN